MFPNRPKPNETEEDLLRFQQQFLASGSKPAAKVFKKQKITSEAREKNSNAALPRDVVKMEEDDSNRENLAKSIAGAEWKTERETKESPEENMEHEMDKHDTHIVAVLSKITERNTSQVPVMFPGKRSQPFPSVFQRNLNRTRPNKTSPTMRGRESIFAQQFRDKPLQDFGIASTGDGDANTELHVESCHLAPLKPGVGIEKLQGIFPSPNLVTGEGLLSTANDKFAVEECRKIHEESLQKLSSMSETEIASERQKLFHEMDPKLVKFLQNKGKRKPKLKEEVLLEELTAKSEVLNLKNVEENSEAQPPTVAPTPMHIDEKWVHMNVIESDKLAWTSMIPEKDRKEITLAHRFDFSGNIVQNEDDIPVHLGLHHHGEEPGAAGYNLKEILILSRSNFAQQRVLAVTLIGKILAKAKQGEYSKEVDEQMISALLDSGVVFLLRWSMDEQSENMIQAAIFAMHSLLCNTATKGFLDTMFMGRRGCEVPALFPENSATKKSDEGDHEILQRDIVAGLVKMNFLQRLRYILEVCRPSAPVVNHCLDILTRICQHSTQCCVAVFECPRLMAFVLEFLLPVNCVEQNDAGANPSKPYSMPFPSAVRLLRAICTGGRHVTSRLLSDFPNIPTLVTRFVAAEGNQGLPGAVFETELEMWRFWIVCCSYGFLHDLFREMYGVIMKHIQNFMSILSTMPESSKVLRQERDISAKRCQLVFVLCSRVLGSMSTAAGPFWQEICSAAQVMISACLKVPRTDVVPNEMDVLISSGMDFLSTYCDAIRKSEKYDITQACSSTESLTKDVLLPDFEHLIKLRCPSQVEQLPCEVVVSLPEHSLPDDLNAVKYFQSFASYLQLSVSVCRLNKDCCALLSPVVCSVAENCTWMLSNLHHDMSFGLLSKTHALFWAVELYILVVTQCPETVGHHATFYHSVAFRCFGQLSAGDEHLMHHLLSSVLFHPGLLRNVNSETSTKAETMEFAVPDRPPGLFDAGIDDLVGLALSCMPAIRSMYMSSFHIDPRVLEQSKFRYLGKADSITKFLLPPKSGPSAPSDWPFIPLLQLYNLCVNGTDAPAKFVPHVSYCLYYLCLLESRFENCLAAVNLTAKIVRLMCVFLAGNDIFLESSVKRCLTFLFSHYCKHATEESLDFSRPIPGISSFYDFFVSLLEHYEGVSYGDDLFTSVVLLPLHQLNGDLTDIRKALWCDRQEVLRVMSLPITKLLVPVAWYLFPAEKDEFTVRSYVSALARGHCSQARSPVPYLIAVHHTASFLFSAEVSAPIKARKEICQGVMKIRENEIRKHILQYELPDPESSLGFLFTDHASVERNNVISILSQ